MYFIACFYFSPVIFAPPKKYCDMTQALFLTMFAVKVVESV